VELLCTSIQVDADDDVLLPPPVEEGDVTSRRVNDPEALWARKLGLSRGDRTNVSD
jgi:hypothetical protein